MAFAGLESFVKYLAGRNLLHTIDSFADPVLEITEIAHRISRAGGKALLFTNNGTGFPILINAFGSAERMAAATGRPDLTQAASDIESIFKSLPAGESRIFEKLSSLPSFLRIASYMPAYSGKKGACQQVVTHSPDLSALPVLKCWPHDGGRFITLPLVHTYHPETRMPNVGMYRMQVLGSDSTAMHWQRHKTGAAHFEAWKATGKRMPVTVTLGGDPVYTYAATAPLPENISEHILAGFLRKKRVRLVKCLTNDIMVPDDSDFVIEGYVDPSENPVWEGPFGDHTGFYSLADWYPRFHVTCITHRRNAIYPATIVGVPPMEDAFLAMATEKLFLAPVRMALSPEVLDFHMPDAGVAHNLVIVKIRKNYPGQGMKVINSLYGAGQMMFSKYIIVVSGEADIRNYMDIARHAALNTDFSRDLLISHGPLDVLDHAADAFSFGGKMGIDATVKTSEELSLSKHPLQNIDGLVSLAQRLPELCRAVVATGTRLLSSGIPLLVVAVDQGSDSNWLAKLREALGNQPSSVCSFLAVAVDHNVDPDDIFMVAWQLLGNSDPARDHCFAGDRSLILDGTAKVFRKGGFPRKWPNVVCSLDETIEAVDRKWDQLGLGPLVTSPSAVLRHMKHKGDDEVVI